MVNFASNLL